MTVVCVPLTSNVRWADAPGNVQLSTRLTGVPKDSLANVSKVARGRREEPARNREGVRV